jgi:hypothetical protein
MGKCADKKWVWRRASAQAINFTKSDAIGTSRCIVESKTPFGEAEIQRVSGVTGFVEEESTPSRLCFCIPGTQNKKLDIAHNQELREHVMTLQGADYAVIGAKKAVSQITVYKCGSR